MTQNIEAIRRFILGGQAIFTVVSRKTNERKTFRVRAAEDVDGSGRPHGWYVDLLIGPQNTDDYRYLCFMFLRGPKELGLKINRTAWGQPAFDSFAWLVNKINWNDQVGFEKQSEFHHAGRCSRCGRTLTTPESVELGIGPVCLNGFP